MGGGGEGIFMGSSLVSSSSVGLKKLGGCGLGGGSSLIAIGTGEGNFLTV